MIDDSKRITMLLGLLAVPGVGAGTVRKLLPFLGAEATRSSLAETVRRIKSVNGKIREALEVALEPTTWVNYEDSGKRTLGMAQKLDVTILPFDSPHYPAYLQLLGDAPVLLFARGRLCDDRHAIACVGTREPSAFGKRATEQITGFLAAHGWAIVSGLAKGIDTIAHRTALEQKARTIAILGNGLDSIYPAVNRDLAEEIIASGGLLLSEQPFGAQPSPRNLVARDRLQSGASVATIIFETSVDGGAMHTAEFARKQQRLVVCPVPPPNFVDLPSCSGVNQLLSKGAYAVPNRTAYPTLLKRIEQQLGTMEVVQSQLL